MYDINFKKNHIESLIHSLISELFDIPNLLFFLKNLSNDDVLRQCCDLINQVFVTLPLNYFWKKMFKVIVHWMFCSFV